MERFDLASRYGFGISPGSYNVVLDGKLSSRGKSGNYIKLYFTDTNTYKRFYLNVFSSNKYSPPKGGPNFKQEIVPGSPLWVEVGRGNKDMPNILAAEYGWRHS